MIERARDSCDKTAERKEMVTTKAWNQQITGYSAEEAKMKSQRWKERGRRIP
jgi:hypothetical protein